MTSGLRIVFGSDDAGYEDKEALKGDLHADDRVVEVTDVGVGADEDTAYPHVAVAAARMIVEGKADRALLAVWHWTRRGDQRQQGSRHSRRHRAR